MPRFRWDKVCDQSKEKCVEDAKKNMMIKNMVRSLDTSKDFDDRGELECSCYPACTSISYEGEISQDDIRYFNRSERSNE